jgi:chemotaxis protein methyltransferase CheR
MLDARFRPRVTFQFHNLARGEYPSVSAGIWGMDLILCRNVLIYLNRESILRVAHRLSDCLAPGGWLITGPSDPPLNDAALEPVITDGGVLYRRVTGSGIVTDGRPGTDARPIESRPSEIAARPVDDMAHTPAPPPEDDEAIAARHVRTIASGEGSGQALPELARQLERHPFSTELHLLRALLYIDLKRDAEAAQALRRVLYLDRSLIVANFLLAAVLRRQSRLDDARRAYRNARDLAKARPPDEPLAFGDGMRAGRIVETADAELARLERPRNGVS